MKRSRTAVAIGLLAGFSLVAAACGDDDETSSTDAPATSDASVETDAPVETDASVETDAPVETDASADAVCPTNLVIQTDWWPELEHGGTYQLIGPEGNADKGTFVYTGPIDPKYAAGGVETVEIRAGGDANGVFQNSSVLASDDDVLFAYINISDVIKDSPQVPMVAVAKTLELDPQMIMWDPTQNDIQAPEDMAGTGKQVLHFDGVAYIDYMVAQGYITADQSNPSYGGSPDQWVAEGGDFFQQGFATNEVYKYENEIEWKDGAPADVSFYTVGDLGFDNYPAAMTIRADRLEEMTPCLEVLVPAMQQAWVDFLADPKPMTDGLIAIAETYDSYWTLSEGLNETGLQILEDEGIAANSADGTYCSFDVDRVAGLAEILVPIYEEGGGDVISDVTAIYTNEFCEGAPGR